MNDNHAAKGKLSSFKPHGPEHCKPCPKPSSRNCLIRFTPLQADIFEDLLDDLIVSIQIAFTPPSGPLPSVFKVLQNLFKSMRLPLRDQAGLFASTELSITAYEQSEGWSEALIAATQSALTELYAFSLLACVSSPVKDGWVSRIRLAETSLAGIENAVPPAISGTVLTFNGGSNIASLRYLNGFPNLGVIAGSGFISRSIPVTAVLDAGVSTILALNYYYAFSMPQNATITSLSASFIPEDITIGGGSVSIQARLCRASPNAPSDAFFDPIPGAVLPLSPTLTGNVSGISCAGSLTGLAIPLQAEDRLIFLFSASATSSSVTPNAISGTLEGSVTLELPNPQSLETVVVPFASGTQLNLEYGTTGSSSTSGAVGFGFSESVPSFNGEPLLLDSSFTQFSTLVPGGGTITSVAVYFGIPAGLVISGDGVANISVLLYRYTGPHAESTPLSTFSLQLPGLPSGTYPENSPGIHAIATDLNIFLGPVDRVLLVCTASFSGSLGSASSINGWVNGGISVIPANQENFADES